MSETTDERVKLTNEQAISMLPEGESIHTFRQAGNALLGADWARVDILIALEKHGFELSGEQATDMGHEMVFLDEFGYVFVSTKTEGEIKS